MEICPFGDRRGDQIVVVTVIDLVLEFWLEIVKICVVSEVLTMSRNVVAVVVAAPTIIASLIAAVCSAIHCGAQVVLEC